MRILFDQETPVAIRRFLAGHAVRTTRDESWATLANGHLLRAVEDAGFARCRQQLRLSENLKGRKIVLSRNRWRSVQRMMPKIVAAIDSATPGSYAIVEIPMK